MLVHLRVFFYIRLKKDLHVRRNYNNEKVNPKANRRLTLPYKRLVSFLTAAVFTFTTISWPAPAAPAAEVRVPSVLDQITLPDSLGRIESRYLPERPLERVDVPILLHLQDAHASYDGQIKIKEILQHLEQNYGFDLILLEGAEGRLDPETLRFFDDDSLNHKVADKLARKALVGGAELFLVERSGSARPRLPDGGQVPARQGRWKGNPLRPPTAGLKCPN